MQRPVSFPAFDPTTFFDPRFRHFLTPVAPAMERLLMLDQLGRTFDAVLRDAGTGDPFATLLSELAIEYRVEPGDLAHIPSTGPLAVVANHPFGMLEGAILAAILSRARSDVKVIANSMLATIPQVRDRFICVNPFGGREAVLENRTPLRRCVEWLRGGGALVVFPAGEVARLDLRRRAVVDPPWNPAAARLIRVAGCPALPVFFRGANGLGFQLLGALHPRLGTAALPRELLNKRGSTIELQIGRLVPARTLCALASDEDAIKYLRCRTDMLVSRGSSGREPRRVSLPTVAHGTARPLAVERPASVLHDEVAHLDAGQKLAELEDLAAYIARGREIPHTLQEIGRLRELTFRAAGEGTGLALDLDAFDQWYLHLFLWNEQKREVAGAYRLGPTPDILPAHGILGLYTSTLFHYRPELFSRIGPAIELGRSFIRPEYQKRFAPLLLLWKGIGQYVVRRPDCAVLFGAVSISNDYNPVSRDLLVSYLERHRDADLARLVKPRRPFRSSASSNWHAHLLSPFLNELEELADPIADLEQDGKGVPILIRQYMKLGGRMLGFNVDASFSNVLDGLILVDLRKAPLATLSRYLSREGALKFLARHQRQCA
ncbi:MAG: GNAT family N-acyltransferase [Bryobacteraceae bacterium]|jgi:putative hemolysin